MSISARQLPGETDRITRAIFEHAAFAATDWCAERRVRSPPPLCNHADTWTAGAEQYDDMTLVGLRVRG